MDEDRIDVILLAKPLEHGNVFVIQRLYGPTTGIAAEYLHGRTAKLVRPLDREGKAAGYGHMKTKTHAIFLLPSS
jgi:hypothetical protein